MKAVKLTDVPSLPKTSGWGADCPLQHDSTELFSRNPSMHVSIEGTEADNLDPQLNQSCDEERHKRLASIGEKVGRLAHDIRNPLSSIEWFATLLGRDHHTQEERQELAEHCIQAVRSLDRLVSNVLIFSAPAPVQREPVNLLALLDDVELLAMYPLRKKGLTIHRHQEGHLFTLCGHESSLKQAFLNLVINAIHASEPDGSIEIHCRNESRLFGEQGKQRLEQGIVLRIRDYGCGMSEEELSHMFRPFYSKRKGGTGLGLSIVKQIVQNHQGLIDITSQKGKGTTVDLFFPQ